MSDLTVAQKEAYWLLLATDGLGLEAKRPRDALSRPWLTFLGYKLMRRTSSGKAAPAWTWRRLKKDMVALCVARHLLNQHRYDAVFELLQRLARQPGFSGVREQVKQLARFARQRGYPGEIPPFLYLSRVSHGTRLALSDAPVRDYDVWAGHARDAGDASAGASPPGHALPWAGWPAIAPHHDQHEQEVREQ